LALQLFRDPHVPGAYKAVPFLALLYLLAPVDLVPDFVPIGGQLDDVAIALTALKIFVTLARARPRVDPEGRNEPSAQDGPLPPSTRAGRVVSATYRVKED
jgi:uncharacterized membrane protein YkvA (DUF1232 family)